jgi:GNAT superfamily N-acetyltransferase
MGTMEEYRFESPADPTMWGAYHRIRRRVLFEARGEVGVYDEEHPDERAPGNHPKLLLYGDEPIGVVRIDIAGSGAILRRVAVRADLQRRGHGRVLLRCAEAFAHDNGCSELASYVAPDAVEFYLKCGFVVERRGVIGASGHSAVFMTKRLLYPP